jgi:hypothetical protein
MNSYNLGIVAEMDTINASLNYINQLSQKLRDSYDVYNNIWTNADSYLSLLPRPIYNMVLGHLDKYLRVRYLKNYSDFIDALKLYTKQQSEILLSRDGGGFNITAYEVEIGKVQPREQRGIKRPHRFMQYGNSMTLAIFCTKYDAKKFIAYLRQCEYSAYCRFTLGKISTRFIIGGDRMSQLERRGFYINHELCRSYDITLDGYVYN